jgi:hypothetical protein
MTKSKLIVSLAFAALLFNANVYAEDAITWSTQRNGAKVADTVALEDYLPLKDGVVYVEAVIEIPNVNRQELFSRAK